MNPDNYKMLGFSLILLSIFIVTNADPLYPYLPPNLPPPNLPAPVNNQLPSYIVYPKGYYVFMNSTNTTNHANNSVRHDFVFGVRTSNDQLLLRTVVFKRPKFWNNYVAKELTFPPPSSSLKVNITQVSAFDRANGTGGFVKVVSGGVGKGSVTVLFNSHKNLPINFGLEIYGMKK